MFKKKTYILVLKLSLFPALACLILFIYGFNAASEQGYQQTTITNNSGNIKPLASKINSIKNSGKVFSEKALFTTGNNSKASSVLSSYLKSFTQLKLNESARDGFLNSREENILFKIPSGTSGTIELELTKVNITTDDFKTASLSGTGNINYVEYTPGLYYRGIIKGDNESFASLSVFGDFVMAVFSNKEGNWNLASIKGEHSLYSENYVLYNDAEMINHRDFKCGVGDDLPAFDKRSNSWSHNPQNTQGDNMPPQLVRKHFECDNKMFQDFGSSTTNVNNYVTAFFNSCATMYAQDSINTIIQDIFIWTTPDVYAGLTDNTRILTRFGGRLQNTFAGDLAHWVSTRTDISGGVAWVGVLCSPFDPTDSSGRYAVSVIDNQLVPFPQYSWVVNVVVHEMGHNLGSNHTHNCSWPGGPIDSCYAVEGGCYTGPLIPRIGTVMSYCHLNSSVNLALGFGHYPGDTIRANVRRAACLPIGITPISSQIPAEYLLQQNYPNPFNPTTNIKFSIPKSGNVKIVVYDITGRETATLVDENMNAGTYKVDFDGSNLASGVYFYKLISTDYSEVKKMVLIK